MPPIITFTSDFGVRDFYVGAVKGVLLSSCPDAIIVDISHQVGSHDLVEAAFVIAGAYPSFPPRTVHLVVVDPGVGSNRRGIIVCGENSYFVAPDNGVLSLVYAREPQVRVISIEADHYFRKPICPTFHARDIFGPVAAGMAKRPDADKFGPEIADYVRFALPAPQRAGDNALDGIVLHIDKFGNVVTNVSPSSLNQIAGRPVTPVLFQLDGKEVTACRSYYAESGQDEIFSIVGSSGYYEISALKKSAAKLLDLKRGAKVHVEFR